MEVTEKTEGVPGITAGAPVRNEALLMLVMAILLFSTLDAIFTLALMETGYVREWNPLMAALIARDVQLFATVKSVITHGGVFLLVAFVHRSLFNRIPVKRILEVVFGAYLLIILYHLVLTFIVT